MLEVIEYILFRFAVSYVLQEVQVSRVSTPELLIQGLDLADFMQTAVLQDRSGLDGTAIDGSQGGLLAFVPSNDDKGSVDLFLQSVMDHMECVIRHLRGLVNGDGIVLPDGVVDHVLLICHNRDVEECVDGVNLEVRVEFLPIVGG